ncbi:MAG TPA: BPSS1780 family membrane protein [Casimicrobiaceae bacterium]
MPTSEPDAGMLRALAVTQLRVNASPPSATGAGAPDPGGGVVPSRVEAGAGASWWGEAWTIFRAAPIEWIGIAIVFGIVSVVLAYIPVVGGIAQTVLAPVFAGGVMLGCDQLARGEPLGIGCLFEGFRGRHFAPLLVLGLIWLAILAVTAIIIVAGTLLALGSGGVAALMRAADSMSFDLASVDYAALLTAGMTFVVLSTIALVIAIIAASAYWFAPALVVLNGETPIAALRASFSASWVNIGAFLLYSVIGIGLAIVASIPLLLGWLVLGPMTAASAYAGWRTIFGRST